MLESRLENEMDMNFAIFGHENDRKRRKIEVSSLVSGHKLSFNVDLVLDLCSKTYTYEIDKILSVVQSITEKAEMQQRIDELQSKMNDGGGDIWDGILEFVKKTVVSTIVPAIMNLNTFSK